MKRALQHFLVDISQEIPKQNNRSKALLYLPSPSQDERGRGTFPFPSWEWCHTCLGKVWDSCRCGCRCVTGYGGLSVNDPARLWCVYGYLELMEIFVM